MKLQQRGPERVAAGIMKDTTRSDGAEIVQVQGGHIIRSTGRKDRHSKVYTSKGPRDRRVRLSAHTAIQFYDVQDRLGYDRPSKAVDWLINKAKTAIDKLNNEVPPPWQLPSQYDSSINSNPSSVLDRHHQPTETLSGYALIQPNNNDNSSNNINPTSLSSFPGFPNDAVLTRSDHHHLHQFHGQDLGLSLHPFQENFQRMDNGSYFMNNNNSIMFSTQGELLQSNLDNNNPLDDQQNNRGRPSWDFGNPFELGFHRVPAGIYGGEEEDDDDDDDDDLQEA